MSRIQFVFIFRRDLRVVDNIGFYNLCKMALHSKNARVQIHPVFIFNPQQIESNLNKYFSTKAFQFMLESLNDLDVQLKSLLDTHLHVFHGNDIDVLKRLASSHDSLVIGFNRDYTPFAKQRDNDIETFCQSRQIPVVQSWLDYSLIDIPSMDKPYKVFGAFYKKYQNLSIIPENNFTRIETKRLFFMGSSTDNGSFNVSLWIKKFLGPKHSYSHGYISGGTQEAIKRLHYITSNAFLKDYETNRNFPSRDGTTLMSAYLKFGCISIRHMHKKIEEIYGKKHPVLRELYWRVFYDQMVYWWPETLRGQLEPRNANLAWMNGKEQSWTQNKNLYTLITNGKSGIPIIDASVKCLKETGFLHNRLRMVLCMVAVRILKIDWRKMEQWFATCLVDYHPSSNRGGWEWAVTYRFKLNPWVQAKTYDPDCVFIKTWLPELAKIPNKEIHTWYVAYSQHKIGPAPLLDRSLVLTK